MNKIKQLILLIPSYEPDEKLEELVEKINKENITSIVIDDGSGPKYKDIFDNLNTKVISYKENKGKGYALKKGYRYIKDNYKDYIVVTIDSDGQHRIEDAMKLYKYVLNHDKTLVLGKRPRSKKTPIRSRIGNWITKLVFNIVAGQYIYDTQTGLRAFSDTLMDYMIKIEGNRYEYEMNVLLNAHKNKIPIHEIEIKTIYIDNNSGSHFNTIKDSYKIYKEIFKFASSSLLSFFIDYILFTILNIFTNTIIISNVISRIVSSTINYKINKHIVFKSNKKSSKSVIEYFSLALIILILNTIILKLLSYIITPLISKLITEIILFTFSWLIQKYIIFKKED